MTGTCVDNTSARETRTDIAAVNYTMSKLLREFRTTRCTSSAKREGAWWKFQPKFDADPELRAVAESYKRYFAARR
jgi:hypothetical protein